MAPTSALIADLDALLEPAAFDDYGPNGLQVPGAEEVSRVATGVSATRALIERAVELEAELVLVHHGLFWKSHPPGLTRPLAERLRLLFKHDIALAAYHLPLDAHPEVGNNAILAKRLGARSHEPFAQIGRLATFDGVEAGALVERVGAITGREPLAFLGGPPLVRTLAIVSGGAQKMLPDALAAGCDAFLTGEVSEHVMADSLEGGIHFISAGHYATETFGVRALGDRLAERFGVEHRFVDLPNPV